VRKKKTGRGKRGSKR